MNNDPNSYWQPGDQPDETPQQQPIISPDTPQPLQDSSARTTTLSEDAPITWTAQEYVHLERNGIWYVLFAVIVLALIATDIFLLKSYTFSVLIVVMAIAVIVYIRRPARSLTYALSGEQGLYIGERLYHLDNFKAFGLIRDGEHNSIMLIPIKRFSPAVSVFFPEEAGERIVDILGSRLPMEDLKLDIIDAVVRKLRL